MLNTVKNAFKDYETNGEILDCHINNVNLYKKSQKIEIELSSEKEINQDELKSLEEYLKNKFNVGTVVINMNVGANCVRPPTKAAEHSSPLQNTDETPQKTTALILGRSEKIKEKILQIIDLNLDYQKVAIEGEVVFTNSRELKNGKTLAIFALYDGTSTITCKSFLEPAKARETLTKINNAKALRIQGNIQYDNFAKENTIIANVIVEIPKREENERQDNSKEKRVELHLHTQMSQMDGVSSATSLIKKASSWGMKAIAITDHGVVQAFPEANKAAQGEDIKVIYGVEAYLVPDNEKHKGTGTLCSSTQGTCPLVFFDIETTGLSFRTEKITEIRSNKNSKRGNSRRI